MFCSLFCCTIRWCFRKKPRKLNFSASFAMEVSHCCVYLLHCAFQFPSSINLQTCQDQSRKPGSCHIWPCPWSYHWLYSDYKALTVILLQGNLLGKSRDFQKIISGTRVTLHFSRSLWPGVSQYFWKASHEEKCGADLFKAAVLQQTASQHPLDNFPMSETLRKTVNLLIYPEDNDKIGVQGEGPNARLANRN